MADEPDTKGHTLSAQHRLPAQPSLGCPASSLRPGKRKPQEQTQSKLSPLSQLPISQLGQLRAPPQSQPLHFSRLCLISRCVGMFLTSCLRKKTFPHFCPSVHLSRLMLGSGPESGAGNRQVFRCVMSDMFTQHEIVPGRRQL